MKKPAEPASRRGHARLMFMILIIIMMAAAAAAQFEKHDGSAGKVGKAADLETH